MPAPAYRKTLRELLTPTERRLFKRLDTPQKIQIYIEKMTPNYELKGETCMSPRRMMQAGVCHCAEAAMFAAAVLIYHGHDAWLMDIQALPSDQDHIVTLFKQRGLWGAISKTNHAVLRWRDPIYRSPRELAMSYAHEYCLNGGKKSMMAFSKPYSLTRVAPKRWVIAPDELDWLMIKVDEAPHVPLAPASVLRRRRRMARVELKSQDVSEWPVPPARRVAKTK
jgi:hypothetical protein